LFRVRLPRALLAVLVGGGLALAGASFQALIRNPLADPYILGVSGGSAFAAIIGMIISATLSFAPVPVFAFAGALAAIFLVLAVARTRGKLPVIPLLLAGVVVNAFFSALVMFLLTIASSRHLPSAIYWMMGQLSSKSYSTIGLVALYYLPGVAILLGLSRDFNLFSLGEESAEQLGVNIERSKLLAFIAASLITAVAVSVSGLIGFVGLMVPHIIRLIFGPDHRLLLPASFIFGGIFLALCDLVARVIIAPAELPVGVITAILGGPFFIWLLRKSKESLSA
jgi:iron complex transport system permease protein